MSNLQKTLLKLAENKNISDEEKSACLSAAGVINAAEEVIVTAGAHINDFEWTRFLQETRKE